MRRVHRHAAVGTVVSALAAVTVLVTAGPLVDVAADVPLEAVPAEAAQSSSVAAAPSASGSAPPAFARESRTSRDAERTDALAGAADERRSTLTEQGKAITESAKKAKEAAEAAERAKYAELGYTKGTTDPREIARQMMRNKFGWGGGQFTCYDRLIISESNWKWDATNPSSGAYGIPQSLPAGKMATAGSDWRTNPATQIKWGLQYVKDAYGTPCSAWSFKQANNWY